MAGPAKARRESGASVDALVPPHSVEAEQAVIGGLLFATVATLFFVPTVFAIVRNQENKHA